MSNKSLLLFFFLMLTVLALLSRSTGPGSMLGLRLTGAPGDDFSCNGCHLGAAGGGNLQVESQSLTGGYTVSDTYNISVSLYDPSALVGGFQIVALDARDSMLGSFIAGLEMRTIWLGTAQQGRRQYVEHTTPKIMSAALNQPGPNHGTWDFKWVAPANGNGAVTFYAASVAADWMGSPNGDFAYSGVFPFSSLAVDFAEVDASARGDGSILLHWKTLREENSDHFVIQRSIDGQSFLDIGRLASSGESEASQAYAFTDFPPTLDQEFFYRIKEVDKDGRTQLSATVEIMPTAIASGLKKLYPSADRQSMIALYAQEKESATTLSLYSIRGVRLWTKVLLLPSGLHRLRIPISDFQQAYYYLYIESGDREDVEKFVNYL